MKTINLDLTTFITLVSDITNDKTISTRYGKLEDWKNINKNIYTQIKDEIENPVLSKLKKELENNKLVMTEMAHNKVMDMINRFGSEQEIKNANELMKKIEIIKGCPSKNVLKKNGRSWNKLNKDIFGTSDNLGIHVATGNVTIAKIILNYYNEPGKVNDTNLNESNIILHRSRCFVGSKYSVN